MFGFLRKQVKVLRIHADWDADAGVWSVTSEDVPGLATWAKDPVELEAKLRVMIPELLELNGSPDCDDDIPLELLIQSEHRLALGC